jgi:hypothetical protein
VTRYELLYKKFQDSLAQLEAAKLGCSNPTFKGGVTDFETLRAFSEAAEKIKRCSAKWSELAQ